MTGCSLTCSRLKDRNVFFGCSVTTTRKNFELVTSEAFVRQMIGTGARVFTFVEYVPMAPGTENLVLTHEQKKTLQAVLSDYNRKFPALFIGFPGDEDTYGGCLAAGRGFVHVSPSGDLEPCPAPRSRMQTSREFHSETPFSLHFSIQSAASQPADGNNGGCALRANREWVQALVKKP